MRATAALLLTVLLVACSSGRPAPEAAPPADAPEVPRAPVELLVERHSRGGARSYYTMAPDGSRVAPFAGVPEDARLAVPSPDGKTLALLRQRGADVHLWLVDREGGAGRPLREGAVVVESVAWSPDGARLVYAASTLDLAADLFTVDATGQNPKHLTPDPLPGVYFDAAPAWSPDGTRIAFSSNRSGVTRLWIMSADGAAPAQVLPASVESAERAPAWSPDGAYLAFQADTPNGGGIGVARPDGTGFRFFAAAGDAGRPSWSPDGRVLYTAAASGNYEVYALDPASGATENLTRHLAHDFRVLPLRHAQPAPWRGLAAPQRQRLGASAASVLAAGDLVRDGAPDLLGIVPSPAAPLRLLASDGTGGFLPPAGLDAPEGLRGLAVADLSRDGIDDVVALGPDALLLWRGGAGGPGLPTLHPLGGTGRGLVVQDFDDDGSPDVAAVHARDGSAFHLLVHSVRQGDGALVAVLDAAASFGLAGRACAGDPTGEGAADVVVLTSGGEVSAVLLPGRGDISFGEAVVAAAGLGLDGDAEPLCADLDGDRRDDLVLLRPGAANGLALLRSTGAAFAGAVPLPATGTSVAAADLDRDGDLDLLVVDPAEPVVRLLRNLGDGRLAQPVLLDAGGAPVRVLATDLDGDRWPDLVVADLDGSVAVLRNLGR